MVFSVLEGSSWSTAANRSYKVKYNIIYYYDISLNNYRIHDIHSSLEKEGMTNITVSSCCGSVLQFSIDEIKSSTAFI